MPYHTKRIWINGSQHDLWEIMAYDQLFGPTPTNSTVEPLPDGDQFVAQFGDGPNTYYTLFLSTEPHMWKKAISLHREDGTELDRIETENAMVSAMTRWSDANFGHLAHLVFWKAKLFGVVTPMYCCNPFALEGAHNRSLTLKWHKD